MNQNLNELLHLLTDDIPADELEADIVLADIAGKLSAERIRRDMSQSEFAKLLGVNQSMVSKMESGDCNFTIRKLIQIAHKLSLPCRVLFGKKPILNYAESNTQSERSNYVASASSAKCNVIPFPGASSMKSTFSAYEG